MIEAGDMMPEKILKLILHYIQIMEEVMILRIS